MVLYVSNHAEVFLRRLTDKPQKVIEFPPDGRRGILPLNQFVGQKAPEISSEVGKLLRREEHIHLIGGICEFPKPPISFPD
jgi:hypothetical protein